jgi:peptide/nickel transport system permease protein
MVIVITVGRFAAPYAPDKIGVAIPGSSPSREHLLGADGLGRDVLSRLLTGDVSVLVTP